MLIQNIINAVISRARPQRSVDNPSNHSGIARYTQYNEAYTMPMNGAKTHALADEGSYFTSTNPTPGTALATIAALTTLTDLSPFILIGNNWSSNDGNAKRIYLDYIKLICGAAGTAGASIRYAVKIGASSFANRYTSGGQANGQLNYLQGNNVNMDDGNVSKAAIQAGALVCAADANTRLVGHGLIRPVIPVVGDTYIINFGGNEYDVSSMAPAGAAIAQMKFGCAPCIIGSQQCAAFHIWLPSQSAASSWEYEIGYWER